MDTSPLSFTPRSSIQEQGPKRLVSISKEIEFDAGHRVPNHKSKCRNPHGHRYRVVAVLTGEVVDEAGASDEGMLLDFGDLKSILMSHVHDPLDHGFIVWEQDDRLRDLFDWDGIKNNPVGVDEKTGRIIGKTDFNIIIFPYIPTAENIAVWCWEQMQAPLYESFRVNFVLTEIHVYETPTSCATYYGPEFPVADE